MTDINEFKKEVGARLKLLRGSRTRKAVCEEIFSIDEYSKDKDKVLANYENGLRAPDLSTLKVLAQYYNVTTDYLLGLTTSQNEANENISNVLGISEKATKNLKSAISTEERRKICNAIFESACFENFIIAIRRYGFSEDTEFTFVLNRDKWSGSALSTKNGDGNLGYRNRNATWLIDAEEIKKYQQYQLQCEVNFFSEQIIEILKEQSND